MKHIFALILSALVLAGCASDKGPSLPESLTLATESTAAVVSATTLALRQGHIGVDEACTVSEYAKLAEAALVEAWSAYVQGDPQTAQEQLEAARQLLLGVATEAAMRAAESCRKGTP